MFMAHCRRGLRPASETTGQSIAWMFEVVTVKANGLERTYALPFTINTVFQQPLFGHFIRTGLECGLMTGACLQTS
jgi:hypothetical protein